MLRLIYKQLKTLRNPLASHPTVNHCRASLKVFFFPKSFSHKNQINIENKLLVYKTILILSITFLLPSPQRPLDQHQHSKDSITNRVYFEILRGILKQGDKAKLFGSTRSMRKFKLWKDKLRIYANIRESPIKTVVAEVW